MAGTIWFGSLIGFGCDGSEHLVYDDLRRSIKYID
jgi:hypothetical protein